MSDVHMSPDDTTSGVRAGPAPSECPAQAQHHPFVPTSDPGAKLLTSRVSQPPRHSTPRWRHARALTNMGSAYASSNHSVQQGSGCEKTAAPRTIRSVSNPRASSEERDYAFTVSRPYQPSQGLQGDRSRGEDVAKYRYAGEQSRDRNASPSIPSAYASSPRTTLTVEIVRAKGTKDRSRPHRPGKQKAIPHSPCSRRARRPEDGSEKLCRHSILSSSLLRARQEVSLEHTGPSRIASAQGATGYFGVALAREISNEFQQLLLDAYACTQPPPGQSRRARTTWWPIRAQKTSEGGRLALGDPWRRNATQTRNRVHLRTQPSRDETKIREWGGNG